MSIVDFARIAHEQKCDHWRGLPLRGDPEIPDGHPGIAAPFGRPIAMPEHRWRVSWDVMQALTEASPSVVGDNPKTAEGAAKLLFGWSIDVDRNAPMGTLTLSRVDG